MPRIEGRASVIAAAAAVAVQPTDQGIRTPHESDVSGVYNNADGCAWELGQRPPAVLNEAPAM